MENKDLLWENARRAACEKLAWIRQRNPDVSYDEKYLVTLTREIFAQSVQIRKINADAVSKRKGGKNEKSMR